MSKFLVFKSKNCHNFVAVDCIHAWHVEEKKKQNPDGELVLKIDDGDPEQYMVFELGYYSIEDAEACVLCAIEQPGTLGVVHYKEKDQQNGGFDT